MNGFAYEEKCARYLRTVGFHRVEVTRQSGDQGIDIIAWRLGKKYGIQCKYYQGFVGNHAVMEACAGAQYYHCKKAIVMTNSSFTAAAQKLSEKTGVVLWPDCHARTGLPGWLLRLLGILAMVLALAMLVWTAQLAPAPAMYCCGAASLLLLFLHNKKSVVSLSCVGYAAAAALLQNGGEPYILPIYAAAAVLVWWLCLLPWERMPQAVRKNL